MFESVQQVQHKGEVERLAAAAGEEEVKRRCQGKGTFTQRSREEEEEAGCVEEKQKRRSQIGPVGRGEEEVKRRMMEVNKVEVLSTDTYKEGAERKEDKGRW